MTKNKVNKQIIIQKALSDTGSAFFYILLGVVLFATLAFTISRGFKGTSTNAMTDRKAEIIASEIMDYAQSISKSIDTLRRKNISENDICFYDPNWGNTTYNGCAAETQKQVFHKRGGRGHFQKMNAEWLESTVPDTNGEYGNIMYTGQDAVLGVGTDGSDDSNQELLMAFPYIPLKVCTFINKMLGLPYTTIPSAATGFHPAAAGKRFTGTYTNGGLSTLYADGSAELSGKTSACIERSGYYVFYNVLIER